MNYCTTIPKSSISAVPRIIVIGDIHGDYMALMSALKIANVASGGRWIGGTTHVVQLGDILDRAVRGGAGDEKSEAKIIDFMIKLKIKAQRDGGDVHILLGNHEIMNIFGDFSYVSSLGLHDFDGNRFNTLKPGGATAVQLGCNAQSVLKIGSWVFSHAGITTSLTERYHIDEVNKIVRNYLLGNTSLIDDPIMDFFWHRDYTEENSCGLVKQSLDNWGVKNMAIGHTVQPYGINNMCGKSLWKTDIGMSDAFYVGFNEKKIEVLEIINDGENVNILKGKKRQALGPQNIR